MALKWDNGGGWKNFQLYDRESPKLHELIIGRNVKNASGELSEVSQDHGKTSSIVLESAYVFMNRILVDLWMLKLFLMSAQKEMGNTLLKAEGMVVLVIEWLNYILELWGREICKW